MGTLSFKREFERTKLSEHKGWYEGNSKMAGWHVVEKYLEEFGKHSTLIGKYWITMFLVLRLLILFSICEAAFGDVGLECDTKTPGCQKMCINQFFPIQPNSHWSLQRLFVSLPIMIFMVYC